MLDRTTATQRDEYCRNMLSAPNVGAEVVAMLEDKRCIWRMAATWFLWRAVEGLRGVCDAPEQNAISEMFERWCKGEPLSNLLGDYVEPKVITIRHYIQDCTCLIGERKIYPEVAQLVSLEDAIQLSYLNCKQRLEDLKDDETLKLLPKALEMAMEKAKILR